MKDEDCYIIWMADWQYELLRADPWPEIFRKARIRLAGL